MTLEEYTALTGITVTSSNEDLVTAQIARTQTILELMLGYTLTPASVNSNQYSELGKTQSDCPDPDSVDLDNLRPADSVNYAYRLFPYYKKDKYLGIDPATAVHKVKLVKDRVTYKTLDSDDYRLDYKNGIIRFIEQSTCFCGCVSSCYCDNVQLAVDADWLGKTSFPNDLLTVWANMVTYYSNPKSDIKSETLGSHSYTRFGEKAPETDDVNLMIIKKYAGPNGSVKRNVTL